MNCSNCGQPAGETDFFCGTCGADLAAQRGASAAGPVSAPPGVGHIWNEAPGVVPPGLPDPDATRVMSATGVPPAAPPPPNVAPPMMQPPMMQPPTVPGAVPPPPTWTPPVGITHAGKGGTGKIVLAVVAGVVVLAGLVTGGLAIAKKGPFAKSSSEQAADTSFDESDTEVGDAEETEAPDTTPDTAATTDAPETTLAPETTVTTTPPTTAAPTTVAVTTLPATGTGSGGEAGAGLPTAEEAAKAKVPADWVVRQTQSSATLAEFWAGPPASEFDTVIVVAKGADGLWRVTEAKPLSQGGDVMPEDEAIAVVEQFERYVQSDEPMKAHALTIEPFSSDGASAQYSNGEFLSFEIQGVEAASDGTYFVTVKEVWKSSTDTWVLRLKQTDEGMRIFELMPAV